VSERKLSVVVVGLRFGAEFVPIYKDHPSVREVGVADLDNSLCETARKRFGITKSYASLEEALADASVDAVHIVTGLARHAPEAVSALDAGKHVACAVPMGLSFEELRAVAEAQRRSGRSYMMMETAVFTREFMWASDLVRSGELGEVCYARGTHFQDMTNWPEYWLGLPPMHYVTHAVAPVLALLAGRATGVQAIGGGRLADENRGNYGRSFPVQCAHVSVEGTTAAVELVRSLFQLARSYTESFSIYGNKKSIEWPQLEATAGEMVLYEMGPEADGRGKPVTATRVIVPDRADLLPEPVRRYTTKFVYGGEEGTHLSFTQGGGHGGSHPHLVHEFISSVVEERPPAVDSLTAANWTAVGIAAHQSSLQKGKYVDIPTFI
jgi:predicted dehydrogenase